MGQPGGRASGTRIGCGEGVTMRVENFAERRIEIDGWPVNLTTYQIGEVYHCKADNVSPGAGLARTTGASRQEAEDKAIARAKELLGRTNRHPV
jgi:hypothetical protein